MVRVVDCLVALKDVWESRNDRKIWKVKLALEEQQKFTNRRMKSKHERKDLFLSSNSPFKEVRTSENSLTLFS